MEPGDFADVGAVSKHALDPAVSRVPVALAPVVAVPRHRASAELAVTDPRAYTDAEIAPWYHAINNTLADDARPFHKAVFCRTVYLARTTHPQAAALVSLASEPVGWIGWWNSDPGVWEAQFHLVSTGQDFDIHRWLCWFTHSADAIREAEANPETDTKFRPPNYWMFKEPKRRAPLPQARFYTALPVVTTRADPVLTAISEHPIPIGHGLHGEPSERVMEWPTPSPIAATRRRLQKPLERGHIP